MTCIQLWVYSVDTYASIKTLFDVAIAGRVHKGACARAFVSVSIWKNIENIRDHLAIPNYVQDVRYHKKFECLFLNNSTYNNYIEK